MHADMSRFSEGCQSAPAVNWSISLKQGSLQALMSAGSLGSTCSPRAGAQHGSVPSADSTIGSVQGLWSLASGGGKVVQGHLGQHKLTLTHTCPDLSR